MNIQTEVRVLAPTGVCGSGFPESSFDAALSLLPHFVGCDAGSTDPGPAYLGSGRTAFPRMAIKRDLRIMLRGALRSRIPLIVGSAGTAGADPHLALVRAVLEEIAAEEDLSFRLAVIHSEQPKDYLLQRFREGRIRALDPAPPLDEAVIERSAHIVGMMGAEPIMHAIEQGADVVLAGRASDTAIFAAIPLMRGIPDAIAWHAAKILECGAAAVVARKNPDCMFAWLRQDHFDLRAPNPELTCTPQSIAAHALYENSNPFRLVESSGTLDIETARYEALDDKSVRVWPGAFHKAEHYTVKLEGAEQVGFQSVLIGSVRDPLIIGQIDDWLARLHDKVRGRVRDVFGNTVPDYLLNIRVYGKNGTMGPLEPVTTPAHELCLVFEVTAPTQEAASAIAGMTRHQALHLPIPEWSGLITGVACPYNYMERGVVYRFNLNHVVLPDSPLEMFPTEMVRVGSAARKAAA